MGHPYLRPNVIPELEMVEIPTAAQGYDNIGQPEYDSPARTYSNSSESSGSSDEMSPGTMPDDSSYLQAMQGGKYPQASDPAADLKKRKADTRGIEKKANEKKARKKRGRFELSERIETSITRSWGACLRCHNQRIRCIPNPTNPQDPDMPCQTCLAVDMSTKKAIHQLPCLRYRLQKIVMYRSGGLNITDRFRHTELVDLFDYPDSEVRTLEISQGICKRPVVVKVRRFNASKDDRLARVHKEGSSLKEYGLPPYCLSDIEETAKEFKQYLLDNALDGLQCAVQDSHEFIKATYGMILQHYQSLPDQIAVGKSKKMVANEEKRVLWDAIVFWFALRHMVGSSWVSGGDTRGLWRLLLPYKVLDGKISTPRMIIAQFESIQHERILKYQAPIVLKSLQKLYYTNNLQHWFTIYCITFMLLHYASLASADRKRWAEQRSLKDTRYGPIDSPLTRYIEELQEGTTYLLAHWHYYKHSVDLLKFDWDRRQGDSSMKHLTPEQGEWMKASSEMLRNSSDHLHKIRHDPARWEDEVYFVSKMYEHTWSPDETFSVTKGIKTQGQ